jgi:hypothetical protein
MDDETRKLVLGEVLFDELRVIREYVSEIPHIKTRVDSIDTRLTNVESKVSIIELTVHKHSRDIEELKKLAS